MYLFFAFCIYLFVCLTLVDCSSPDDHSWVVLSVCLVPFVYLLLFSNLLVSAVQSVKSCVATVPEFTSTNVPVLTSFLILQQRIVVGFSVFTMLCLCWLCAGLCCVPVVFDSGRCGVPHGHQFSTNPTRGRQRAELISIHFKYWNLILAYSVTLSLQLHFFHCVCGYIWACTRTHKSSYPSSVSA